MRVARTDLLNPYDTVHKMWQAHDHQFLMERDEDKVDYLNQLFRYYPEAYAGGVRFHAFCIMDSHVHEILQIGESSTPFSDMMRNSHATFGARLNKRHGRRGKVGIQRPKTKSIQTKPPKDPSLEPIHPVIRCMCYLDANPVLAGIVTRAEDWAWSSYRLYAYGEETEWSRKLTLPDAYLALGDTPRERQAEYRRIYRMCLRDKMAERDGVKEDDQGEPRERVHVVQPGGPTAADFKRGHMDKGRFRGDPDWVALREVGLQEVLREARQRQCRTREEFLMRVEATLMAHPPPWGRSLAA
jgi:putative transposase